MKKILSLIIIIISIFSISFVYAEEKNKLYISSKDNKLYYDSEMFDEDIFLHFLELVPGEVYEEELLIENDTVFPCDLYFKIIQDEQSELAEELLDNIIMKIYLDDEIIYDGKVKGEDYLENGVNLQDSIYLGKYEKKASETLKVEVKLDEEYSNIDNEELAKTTWEFYASVDNEIKTINPNTYDFFKDNVRNIFISILLIIFAIFIYCYMRKVSKKNEVK